MRKKKKQKTIVYIGAALLLIAILGPFAVGIYMFRKDMFTVLVFGVIFVGLFWFFTQRSKSRTP